MDTRDHRDPRGQGGPQEHKGSPDLKVPRERKENQERMDIQESRYVM